MGSAAQLDPAGSRAGSLPQPDPLLSGQSLQNLTLNLHQVLPRNPACRAAQGSSRELLLAALQPWAGAGGPACPEPPTLPNAAALGLAEAGTDSHRVTVR